MTHEVFHQLVGYDRASGRIAVEHDIPESAMAYAKSVAKPLPDDPDAVFCYRLTSHQARDIAGTIGVVIDADAFNFYMEGSSEPLKARA